MKKLLLITYYFPPCGGVSVQRWLLLSKYLLAHDWMPTIVTTNNGDYPYTDYSLINKITPMIKVIRTYTPTFKGLFNFFLGKAVQLPYGSLRTSKEDKISKRFLYFLRTQLVSPDSRIIWNQFAFHAADQLLRSGVYDIVITTGPPHSTHLVGLKLKKKYKINWVADFRDLWSKIYYLGEEKRNIFVKKIDQYYERKVVKGADQVITVSQGFAQSLGLGQDTVITNAFDPEDFTNTHYQRTNQFRVKFIGALTDSRKKEVLEILHWIDELAIEEDYVNIEFSLIGAYDQVPEDLTKRIKKVNFMNIPFMKHENTIQACVDSEILLLVINQAAHNQGILPFKLFEYLGARTKILGIGPAESDVKQVLTDCHAGSLYDFGQKKEFLLQFKELYLQWQRGGDLKNQHSMEKYSVQETCRQYNRVLTKLVEERRI